MTPWLHGEKNWHAVLKKNSRQTEKHKYGSTVKEKNEQAGRGYFIRPYTVGLASITVTCFKS